MDDFGFGSTCADVCVIFSFICFSIPPANNHWPINIFKCARTSCTAEKCICIIIVIVGRIRKWRESETETHNKFKRINLNIGHGIIELQTIPNAHDNRNTNPTVTIWMVLRCFLYSPPLYPLPFSHTHNQQWNGMEWICDCVRTIQLDTSIKHTHVILSTVSNSTAFQGAPIYWKIMARAFYGIPFKRWTERKSGKKRRNKIFNHHMPPSIFSGI